jgi:hypothetical protein
MALCILQLDGVEAGVEIRTSDPMVCRTIWRLMSTAVTPAEMSGLVDMPQVPPAATSA